MCIELASGSRSLSKPVIHTVIVHAKREVMMTVARRDIEKDQQKLMCVIKAVNDVYAQLGFLSDEFSNL
ncbi:hypothetical protein CPF11_00165 [Acetobacter pomorum]|nr:hypothetical protein CPF11_00165 [Acetobacter pomorum]